jgi:hypothetical protein
MKANNRATLYGIELPTAEIWINQCLKGTGAPANGAQLGALAREIFLGHLLEG